jgi:hypothetical protein
LNNSTHARASKALTENNRARRIFHGVFYGLRNFVAKPQLRAMQRDSDMTETRGVCNDAQAADQARKNSFLN